MPNYRANQSFDDDRLGRIKRDQLIENLRETSAKYYLDAGLIRLVIGPSPEQIPPNPISAAGTQLSALPVAPVSPQAIVKKSKRGRK